MLENMSPRERRLAAVTFAVVCAAVVYRLVFFPELAAVWDLDERVAASSLDLVEMEKAVALTEGIEARYKAYETAISQKGTDLEEWIAFLKTVSDLTAANEMKLVSQEQPPIEVGPYYRLYSVRLGIQTRPVWLARFLASLEESDELIRVEDIKITALDDAENLAVNVKLTKVVAAKGTVK